MPIFSAEALIGMSLTLAVGSFGLFRVLFERGFQRRYDQYRKQFHRWLNRQISDFIAGLQGRISKNVSPAEVIQDIQDWVEKKANLTDVSEEAQELDKTSKNILYALGGAVALQVLGIISPERINPGAQEPVFWGDLATWAFFLGVYLVFRYMLSYQSLLRRMSAVERGTPFEKIFEKELTEEE